MLHTPYHNERVNASSSCCQSTFIDDYEEEEEEQGDLQVGNYAEEELCTNIQTQTSPKWWEVVAEKKDPRTKKIASKKGFTPVATTMRWRRRPPPSPSKKPTQVYQLPMQLCFRPSYNFVPYGSPIMMLGDQPWME